MSRINLLKEKDIELFDNPIELSNEERKILFTLEFDGELDPNLRKGITTVGYILQKGYFLAQKKFFVPNQFKKDDINYVSKLCGLDEKINILEYKKSIYNKHRVFILNKFGYRSFTDSIELFEKEAIELVKTPLRPKELFYSLISFLEEKKIEQPKHYIFAQTIAKSLNLFEQNLVDMVDKNLTIIQKNLLDEMMKLPTNDDEVTSKNPYLITKLKRVIQAITPRKIKESIDDFNIIRDMHFHLSNITKMNEISGILNYYAVWVVKAEHIQFDSIRDIERKRLYIVSFIIYQYRIRQDSFVDIFLQVIQKYYNNTNKLIANDFLKKDLKPSKQKQLMKIRNIIFSSKKQLEKVKQIIFTNQYGDSEKLRLVKNILASENESFHDNIIQEIDKLENLGTAALKEELFFKALNNGYRKIHNRVGGILLMLEFNIEMSDSNIIAAIKNYQTKNGKITHISPTEFIAKNEQKWLFNDNGEFNTQMYKILLFKEISNHIKAGTLNLKFSDKYKSIDDYLIGYNRWKLDKKELLDRANINHLCDMESALLLLKENVAEHYKKTNENIITNEYLKFSKDNRPRVTTTKLSESTSHFVHEIIGENIYIPLTKILSDINFSTNYTSSFLHYSRKSSKDSPAENIIYAAIIALGCNIGVRKMGKISTGVGADKLEYVVRWFFSKDNIDEANRMVLDIVEKLSLPKIYLQKKDSLHTSSDGQKFNVTVPSINATHSFKYFGTGKGVSAYSFIDEKSKLFYNSVISASEREAGYILDGLLHNKDIESDMHSTDTHGYSEVIFGVCNSLGILFAPRIKNYNDQLLYTFKEVPRNIYENKGYKILPSKSMYIDESMISDQWENILRLLCSIKLGETKASIILKRLSSYAKQHPLHKAIKEIGRIHKTIFLLRYFDETHLRQNIEKQLNKIELSHLFAKAVFFGNNQEFKYETKEEQEIVVACRHLIQNAIILWNYLFISNKLSEIEEEDEVQKNIELMKSSSIMTWQHVNMHGEYDFIIDLDIPPFDMIKINSLKIN